jgi:hypothetical protein
MMTLNFGEITICVVVIAASLIGLLFILMKRGKSD